MKILHLITRLILGGAQENTLLTCEGLTQKGHDVTLAFGPIYGPEGSLLERAKTGGYKLVELPAMVRQLNPLTDLRCYKQTRKLIDELQPDVVHTHSSKAGIIGRIAAQKTGVPAIVHTIHGLAFHPYQSRIVHNAYVAVERYAARRCQKIVSVADAMTKQALAQNIGRADQYATVYSGMEVEPFTDCPVSREQIRSELGIARDEIVIGTVARLAELKGHDDLLDALGAMLRERGDVRLLWVGDGWWRGRLEQRITELGLSDRVTITGLVPPDRIPAMMRAMDVLAHPSYREGLARALPQALLSGVPIVSYDCDGAGEVCIEGETGRLVRTGDTAGLTEAIGWMVDHPAERGEMAEAGREMCRSRFDWRVMTDRLEAIYRGLLGGTK